MEQNSNPVVFVFCGFTFLLLYVTLFFLGLLGIFFCLTEFEECHYYYMVTAKLILIILNVSAGKEVVLHDWIFF